MNLISIKEYAELHGVKPITVREKIQRGGFETARKIGRSWAIDKNEPYIDRRKTGEEIPMDQVARTYKESGSIRETAHACNLSEVKTRRILITKDLYSTPLSRQINALIEQGLTPAEIQKKLNISKAMVYSYLPYQTRKK